MIAQAALFNKNNPCRELKAVSSDTSSISRNLFCIPERESVFFAVGKGQETDNYTKMSLSQPWRYAQSIMDAQKGNPIQSWES